jgi:methionyl-tRNA formyltransferase
LRGDGLRIVFFGTPEFAVPSLKILLNSEYKVLAVVTQPDRQSGRGRHLTPSPVKIEAQRAGLKILQPQKVKDPDFIKELKMMNPSAIVVVAFGQILPPEIIHLPELGCINVHASLLPRYRGAAPINWVLINGEKVTGITTILMDEGMDTGPILLQEKEEIRSDDTVESLSLRLSEMGANVLLKTLKGLEKRRLKPTPQVGDATYAPILKKTDGLIKWSRSAIELSNFIRGVNPWPGAYSFLEGERVKILKAEPVNEEGEAGVIEEVTKGKLLVGTGKGMLSILEIQPAGKSIMTIKAFLQGRVIKKGMRFHEKPMD